MLRHSDFLELAAVGAIMALAAAVHSPYAESLVAVWGLHPLPPLSGL
jgi:hypothetical protein